jgi:cysteinyl-tRNA synthetase
MTLKIYNTLSKKVETFRPVNSGKVGLYVCGPTVYDRAHIGNARPVVVFDTLYRVLSLDYQVTYVKNITDIDDKIIKAAHDNDKDILELTKRTTQLYRQDMAALGVIPPTIEPKATDHVMEMISMIETLIGKGHAYARDSHVLFDTISDPAYGSLSNHPLEEMIAGARIEVAPYKKNPQDFVLWKPSRDHEPGWQSPWGRGRPGWHIECSAMSLKHLGKTFDIHGGGIDLSFPHHENEIAQSTCALGKGTFARYWMHNGMLMVNGSKMSKSLGNFFTVKDLLSVARGETIRFAMLSTHYRQPLDWQEETTLSQSKAALDALYTALQDFDEDAYEESSKQSDPKILEALQDDLNTPLAISYLHELAKKINKSVNAQQKKELQNTLKASAYLLGLLSVDSMDWFQGDDPFNYGPKACEIEQLIEQRKKARANKDFIESDRIRDYLLSHKITLEDSSEGTIWKRR